MDFKIKILVIALISFNIIISCFLILDIQSFQTPKTDVRINIIDINSDELTIETIVNIQNINNFDISIKNFEVISFTQDGEDIGKIYIEGGIIKAKNTKSFSSQNNFILKNENITVLKHKLNALIGLNLLGFIKKSIPLEIDLYTSFENIFNQIKQPDINIEASFTEIYEKGLNFTTKIEVFNPTHLLYKIEEIILEIEKEDGTNVGKILLFGDMIEPKKTITLISNGSVFFDAFDASVLSMKLNGIAGIKIAGIYKNVNISAESSIIIPDIKEFIFGNRPIDFKIPVQFKLTLRGILGNIGFEIYNPSNITLVGEELVCSMIRQDGDTFSLLGEKIMEKCTLLPQNEICVGTNITISYLDYLIAGKGRLRPDWLILRVEGDFKISGTRQKIPISLNAYVDPFIILKRNLTN